jgi:hypothetical protein
MLARLFRVFEKTFINTLIDMNRQLLNEDGSVSQISVQKLSSKKRKIMENQFFDSEGNLFTSLCKSNIGTPFDSRLSSVKASPLYFEGVSTPGSAVIKMTTKTPSDGPEIAIPNNKS